MIIQALGNLMRFYNFHNNSFSLTPSDVFYTTCIMILIIVNTGHVQSSWELDGGPGGGGAGLGSGG